jgi:hypothetical protein
MNICGIDCQKKRLGLTHAAAALLDALAGWLMHASEKS